MICASKPANSSVSESRKVGKSARICACTGAMVLELLMTNRKSILPRQPLGPGGPKSGGGPMPVLLDVSPADGDVEPAELVELVELPDPPVVEVEPTEVSMSGIEAGPAPKLDAAGAAGLHAKRHSARGIGVRRTALLYLGAASPSGYSGIDFRL